MEQATATWEPERMISFPVAPIEWQDVFAALDAHAWWRKMFSSDRPY
jgi:hypothetical protein